MSKYRKLPIEIDAFKIGFEHKPEWFHQEIDDGKITLNDNDDGYEINTLEGVMTANWGDYIIKGVNGELYPLKPDIFAKTYEFVNDTD